jgi:predicted tellurium resistance membrane protein TerC
MDFSGWNEPETWVALLSLCAMEIVLGIDNLVFITILTGRLPASQRSGVARLGLFLALGLRIALLFAIAWVMSLTQPLFSLFGREFAGKHLILLGGGLFLVGKAVTELHGKVEARPHGDAKPKASSAGWILVQVLALDVVFSLDSVITAVGMVEPDEIWVMVVAVVVAVIVMMAGANSISAFVTRHPTVKVLALSFLILIGVMLVAEGLGQHIPKGYIYFAMAFALGVELINIRVRHAESPSERPQEP